MWMMSRGYDIYEVVSVCEKVVKRKGDADLVSVSNESRSDGV